MDYIHISGARENNLKSVSLRIPKGRFVLVTGVSGSGKSSLVQNVIANEGQRLYLSQLNPRARQYFGRLNKAETDDISGLSPVVSLDQVSFSSNLRSTVGTLSELYDYLRLLFARYSVSPGGQQKRPNRSSFSFNMAEGACPECKGLGIEEYIDPSTFILNPGKSIKEGALSLTTPNGYIIYSQVTLEVLEKVCKAEGFELDKAWDELDKREKDVILYGSDKIRIPFGKHPLESRMKWSGITAKPRDEGYYRGMIPIMEEILKRDRNKNILKYTRSRKCQACNGKRLNEFSLSWYWQGRDIAEWAALPVESLGAEMESVRGNAKLSEGEVRIVEAIYERVSLILRLGLGYLTVDRESSRLSSGEVKRLRLSTLIQDVLSGVLYTLDEPTVGLHPVDHNNLLEIMRQVCDLGNSMIVIDHKNIGFDYADYWIEMGPGAGHKGGEVIFAGKCHDLHNRSEFLQSSTWLYLSGAAKLYREKIPADKRITEKQEWIRAFNLDVNNLRSINPRFQAKGLNIICGVSGAGKSSLLSGSIYPLLSGEKLPGSMASIESSLQVNKIIRIDQKPIGRNSRSNPATYTRLFDKIRDLYGKLPQVIAREWDKSRFSFNVEGGRCPQCKGAGATEIGVSYLGSVEIVCESCQGKRFTDETLEIQYRGRNIFEVLEMEVDEAKEFFREEKTIFPYLKWLSTLGLGYLRLGQPSGTLSGGEAQRIKLASELVRPARGHTVYLLDEPASGLHPKDIQVLLNALDELIDKGNTIILVEHDPDLVSLADWVVELGPGGGNKGGELIFSGRPEDLMKSSTPMSRAIDEARSRRKLSTNRQIYSERNRQIVFRGVQTNNLRNIDVTIPLNQITAITGVSGSGKTSLVFDTIFNTSRYYFTQTYSTYVRSLIGGSQPGEYESASGLLPAIAIEQKPQLDSPRSTMATLTGIMPVLRLLFARFAFDSEGNRPGLLARQFSFNDKSGACMECAGLGRVKRADPSKLVANSDQSVFDGAFAGTKAGLFFTDPDGQYMAILRAVESNLDKDFSNPWNKMAVDDRQIILSGTGAIEYDVVWNFKRKNRTGTHKFRSAWKGILNLVNEEYNKREGTSRQHGLEEAMMQLECPGCNGSRFNPERLEFRLGEKNISEWLDLNVDDFVREVNSLLSGLKGYNYSPPEIVFIENLFKNTLEILYSLSRLGMGYIQLSREASSLSSGEYQRARLASQLVSGLSGMLYLIDEPSTALHPQNLDALRQVLSDICARGNTIVIIDHNPLFYSYAGKIYELGPGGGDEGGHITSISEIAGSQKDFHRAIPIPEFPQPREGFDPVLYLCTLENLGLNNLDIKELKIPKGWVCIAGVSGSGKSSLVKEMIKQVERQSMPETLIVPAKEGTGWPWYKNPLSALGVDAIMRKDFCALVDKQGLKPNPDYFLLTRKGGRCEECQGKGHKSVSLDYLGESLTKCEECNGTGFNEDARKFKYQGISVDGFLDMSINKLNESCFFPSLTGVLETTVRMGLGYLKAGQKANTLSPGEKQRLMLVRKLCSGDSGKSLFVFDEPSRGLHKKDSDKFIALVGELIKNGNSVVMVEHNPFLLSRSDWVIELGPGGGDSGGNVIYSGRPSGLAGNINTPTSRIMKQLWGRRE